MTVLQTMRQPSGLTRRAAAQCLVHIRRHFEQALDENREIAEYGLTQIQHIYRIEYCCDKACLSYDERKTKCREQVSLVINAMRVWMETEGIKFSPNSQVEKAITYAYTRWDNMMGCRRTDVCFGVNAGCNI